MSFSKSALKSPKNYFIPISVECIIYKSKFSLFLFFFLIFPAVCINHSRNRISLERKREGGESAKISFKMAENLFPKFFFFLFENGLKKNEKVFYLRHARAGADRVTSTVPVTHCRDILNYYPFLHFLLFLISSSLINFTLRISSFRP